MDTYADSSVHNTLDCVCPRGATDDAAIKRDGIGRCRYTLTALPRQLVLLAPVAELVFVHFQVQLGDA